MDWLKSGRGRVKQPYGIKRLNVHVLMTNMCRRLVNNQSVMFFLFCIRVFHTLYKVGRNGNFVFKGFNNSKKKVTSSGARPGATDYCWFRSPMPNHMS